MANTTLSARPLKFISTVKAFTCLIITVFPPVRCNCFHPGRGGGGFRGLGNWLFYAALVLSPFICLPPFLFLLLLGFNLVIFPHSRHFTPLCRSPAALLFTRPRLPSSHFSRRSNQPHLFHKQLVSLFVLMNMIPQQGLAFPEAIGALLVGQQPQRRSRTQKRRRVSVRLRCGEKDNCDARPRYCSVTKLGPESVAVSERTTFCE